MIGPGGADREADLLEHRVDIEPGADNLVAREPPLDRHLLVLGNRNAIQLQQVVGTGTDNEVSVFEELAAGVDEIREDKVELADPVKLDGRLITRRLATVLTR